MSIAEEFKWLENDQRFLAMKSFKERIAYILTNVVCFQQLKEEIFVHADVYRSDHIKNKELCLSFQKEGHQYFEREDYELAKQCFSNV